jgi:hypothetical protein
MSGAVESDAGASIGLGKAVVLTASAAVVAAVAVVAWSRLTGDEGPALAADELEPSLLTAAEVDEAATVPGPYEQAPFEASIESVLYRLDNGLVADHAVPGCNELVRRALPDAREEAEGVAFRRADGTLVLQTLDVVEDDRPVGDLAKLSCGGTWAEDRGGTLVLIAAGDVIDGLGDGAFKAYIDAHPVRDGELEQGRSYLDVVIFERDGVVSTVTVARGTNLSSQSDLAVSVAEAADAKLAATFE